GPRQRDERAMCRGGILSDECTETERATSVLRPRPHRECARREMPHDVCGSPRRGSRKRRCRPDDAIGVVAAEDLVTPITGERGLDVFAREVAEQSNTERGDFGEGFVVEAW